MIIARSVAPAWAKVMSYQNKFQSNYPNKCCLCPIQKLITMYLAFLAVLFVSVAKRTKVCALSKYIAPWSKAEQFVPKCKLWPQDRRLWACKDHLRDRSHDGVCGHSLVQGTGAAVELFTVHCRHWCLVSWMHTRWNRYSPTPVSWAGLHPAIKIDHWGKFNVMNCWCEHFS
jgi:hypothetical protein